VVLGAILLMLYVWMPAHACGGPLMLNAWSGKRSIVMVEPAALVSEGELAMIRMR
jgi:hypothetical protein